MSRYHSDVHLFSTDLYCKVTLSEAKSLKYKILHCVQNDINQYLFGYLLIIYEITANDRCMYVIIYLLNYHI